MAMLDLKVLEISSKKIVEQIKHQKDAQRNSVQKEVLNSSPSFFSASLAKKTLIILEALIVVLSWFSAQPVRNQCGK